MGVYSNEKKSGTSCGGCPELLLRNALLIGRIQTQRGRSANYIHGTGKWCRWGRRSVAVKCLSKEGPGAEKICSKLFFVATPNRQDTVTARYLSHLEAVVDALPLQLRHAPPIKVLRLLLRRQEVPLRHGHREGPQVREELADPALAAAGGDAATGAADSGRGGGTAEARVAGYPLQRLLLLMWLWGSFLAQGSQIAGRRQCLLPVGRLPPGGCRCHRRLLLNPVPLSSNRGRRRDGAASGGRRTANATPQRCRCPRLRGMFHHILVLPLRDVIEWFPLTPSTTAGCGTSCGGGASCGSGGARGARPGRRGWCVCISRRELRPTSLQSIRRVARLGPYSFADVSVHRRWPRSLLREQVFDNGHSWPALAIHADGGAALLGG